MTPPNRSTTETTDRSALIHREIGQLGILIAVAISAFLLTRLVAANNREMNLRDAAEWYRRGEEAMSSGHLDDAIAALRRAAVRDRTERRYLLALARALALKPDPDAARAVLLTLRESAPEDPEINLQLARLAATRSDVTEAVRYYHNALYAPWSPDEAATRRAIRLELIRFLLTHDQPGRAHSELVALSADLPDEAPVHLEVAKLFVQAGDNIDALDQFRRVLRLDPSNDDALVGAGQAAFRLGNYADARTYLRRAPADDTAVVQTREVVDFVLSDDPLAKRLGSAERRRRLVDDFAYVRERLLACAEQMVDAESRDSASALRAEAEAFDGQLAASPALEQDTVETGVDLIYRMEDLIVRRCGPPTAHDQALVLIGRQHGAATR